MAPHPDDVLPSIEHDEDEVTVKDSRVAKKQNTNKSVGPEPKNAKTTSRGPTNKGDHDNQPSTKLKRATGSPESETSGAKGNKRKRSQEDDSVEDSQLVKRLKLTIEKLEFDLKKTKNYLQRWHAKALRLRDNWWYVHTELQAVVKSPTPEDQQIMQSKFKELTDRIFAWVVNHLVSVFESEAIPEEVEKMLDKVSERPFRKFLTRKPHAMMLLQALVWRFLCTELFDNPFKLWGKNGEIGQVLASIQGE